MSRRAAIFGFAALTVAALTAGVALLVKTGLTAAPSASAACPEFNLASLIETAQDVRLEWMNTWLGVPIYQFPTDLLTYQELIVASRPEVVVETGTAIGGLSVFLASVFDNLDSTGTVVTVDIDARGWEATAALPMKESIRNRITFIRGDSISAEVQRLIREKVANKRAMLILDSAHHKQHVRSELDLYASLIPVGGYIVVNDTHLDGTAEVGFRPGPRTAVEEFVAAHPEFVIDNTKQRFAISCFHSGILKRIR